MINLWLARQELVRCYLGNKSLNSSKSIKERERSFFLFCVIDLIKHRLSDMKKKRNLNDFFVILSFCE